MRLLLLHFIGNSLIVLSIVGFIFIFYPLFQVYFSPHMVSATAADKGFSITIPKIGAQAKIIAQVDPWNEQEYRAALSHGVAQAKGTSLPGQSGTMFLFAHSSDVPWRITRYNTPFLRLGELNSNDTIYIVYKGKSYHYTVTSKKIVWPSDVSYLTANKKTQLILQTCYPIGTSFQRLLVFATPSTPGVDQARTSGE